MKEGLTSKADLLAEDLNEICTATTQEITFPGECQTSVKIPVMFSLALWISHVFFKR